MSGIMIIDPNKLFGEMSRDILKQKGYMTEWVGEPGHSLDMLRAVRFDLIILDLGMKSPDGYLFLSLLKGDPALKSIPVLALGFKETDDDKQKVLGLGAAQWVLKRSCSPAVLLKMVQEMMPHR